MKNYIVSDYNDWKALSADMTSDLLEAVSLPVSAVHKAFGACSINTLSVNCNEASMHVMAAIEFANGQTKQLALDVLMANGLVQLDEPKHELLTDYIKAFIGVQKEVHEIALDRSTAKAAADRKAAEEKKAEEKYLKTKEKALQDFEARTKVKNTLSTAHNFYYALGWLAKHVGTVSAALPDYLEKAFTSYFGADTPCRIVDSKHRGPAGWQAQWSWSFTISLKKPGTIPAALIEHLNPAGKAITNTTFVWDLIDNYGFQFGKTQDVEKIRATVPAAYLEQFERGFAA
jgi:hypothetical protein